MDMKNLKNAKKHPNTITFPENGVLLFHNFS